MNMKYLLAAPAILLAGCYHQSIPPSSPVEKFQQETAKEFYHECMDGVENVFLANQAKQFCSCLTWEFQKDMQVKKVSNIEQATKVLPSKAQVKTCAKESGLDKYLKE